MIGTLKYITGVEMVSQKSSLVATEGLTPFQQMVASCSGAIITSLFGRVMITCLYFKQIAKTILLMLDVYVKQACFCLQI